MKIPKVKISAKAYDEALRFCNARLKEQGKKPIKKLPAGYSCDPCSCPCSTATGVRVFMDTWRGAEDLYEQDGGPAKFVREFDNKCGNGSPGAVVYALPIRGLK